MAELAKALPGVLKHEGGFVNDPADAGGMTYRGISRRYHPSWGGWEIIDAWIRAKHPIDDPVLEGLVERFYRMAFWDRFQGDRIRHQALAEELLDQAVNLGVHRAVEHLQRALNALNNRATLWPDIVRDGELGASTIEAIDACVQAGRGAALLTAVSCQQGAYYLERMEARAVNERFAVGWLGRV